MGYVGVALCIMMSQTCGGLESKRLDGSCLVGGMMELNEKHTLKHASMWWWVMRLKERAMRNFSMVGVEMNREAGPW